MILYFVRHTTPNIDKGICYGQADIDVTNSFNTEASLILSKINDIKMTAAYSSPLQRCTKLATKIATDFKTHSALKELNFGDWELKNWDEISKEQLTPWMEDFVNVAVTNGESYTQLYNRVVNFIKGAQQENGLFISHAGVIRSALCYYTQTSLKDSFNFKIPYGAVVKINTKTQSYELL